MQLIFGGGLILVFAFASGSLAGFELQSISTRSALSLVYLVIAGSLVAFSAYMYLLSVTSPALVATYAFVNPVVAVLLGAVFAGERVSGRIASAGAVIVGAVILITVFGGERSRRWRSRTETLPAPVREAP
jgi:drug/metabolite transporter (DMT)-like permease